MKYTIKWESNGKKRPCYGKSMSTSFPGSPNVIGFVTFPALWKTDGETHAFLI